MKKLSIIIPVYDEEKTISKLLTEIQNIEIPLKKDIIVVDDGSNDNSLEILKTFFQGLKKKVKKLNGEMV